MDTADGALRRAGWAARLRSDPSGVRLSLKTRERAPDEGPAPRALHRRQEIEGPADATSPPATWPASAARERLLALVDSQPLAERFVIQQLRRERELRGPQGGRALLSLDDVSIRRDGRELGRAQVLEIELRKGDRRLLADLAEVLESGGGLLPEPRTKERMAEELLDDAPRRRGTALPRRPGVRANDPVAEAGRKVISFHLARMLDRQPGAGSGDVDDVHRMRVATRRMRAAWRVFGDAYRRADRRRQVAELRTVARALGAVRDLDVLLEGLVAYEGSLEVERREGLTPLREAWAAERVAANARLRKLLGTKAYQRFVADYRSFAATPGAGVQPGRVGPERLVRDSLASRVWEAYERVHAYDETIATADVPTLHALRIEGKRLRYTLEFFQEVLGVEAAELIERVTALQDELGALHDADVAAGLARTFLGERRASLTAVAADAIAGYLAERERDLERRRRRLSKAWSPVASVSFRRALGRALSAR